MTGLKRTPRSRGGFTLVELIVVLTMLVRQISDLFVLIKALFEL